MINYSTDTIVAIATPPGMGGIGIVRISGPEAVSIAQKICLKSPPPRSAVFTKFFNNAGEVLDEGIVIYFPSPGSFTGDDVVEFQSHGSPVVLNNIIKSAVYCGARLARPGEFSERAFLNGKMDLLQVEAVADLIESTTEQAAKLATKTLNGDFSKRIVILREELTDLRSYIEAFVDFLEDDVDLIPAEQIIEKLSSLQQAVENVFNSASQGRLIRDGICVVIAGKPNSGKSTLLNALSGYDSAIVSPLAGTTRDLMRENINLDGLPLHIIDTAGLREVSDLIEQEGIRRAKMEIERADCILWIFDESNINNAESDALRHALSSQNIIWINNKIDVFKKQPGRFTIEGKQIINLSAKTGAGVDILRQCLKEIAGFNNSYEGEFIARERHLNALNRVRMHLNEGAKIFIEVSATELLAEELRMAQNALSEITGEFVTEDLLDEVFSRFCIGK